MTEMEMGEFKKYLNYIMNEFNKIGKNEENKGVTRLGYTKTEDKIHDCFLKIAKNEKLHTYRDEVGNSYAYLKKSKKYDYIGSHLDSVVEGGKYDGVLGVAIGLSLLLYLRDKKIDLPLKVIALRCEESSNFMYSMIGSKLITGSIDEKSLNNLTSLDRKRLKDIFREKSYSMNPSRISDIKNFIELHIEQGRVLESKNKKIGIVNTIAGSCRFLVRIKGLAEHSGATPMEIRKDSLCAASEIILEIENIGELESDYSVGTVGYINNVPNAMNVVPGETEFSVDFRDIENDSMTRMKNKIKKVIERVCNKRKVSYELIEFPISCAVDMNKKGIKEFEEISLENNINYLVMPSGAGHDSMIFTNIVNTNLIFIPCKEGISHNPKEDINIDDAVTGANLILKYLERINYVN
mgnify:CR=1 FL=1